MSKDGDLLRMKARIDSALEYAVRFGSTDGAHHKQWVIDQMVRALTGCPLIEKTDVVGGKTHKWSEQGESPEYAKLVADAKAGEDGPETYEWDEGIAP